MPKLANFLLAVSLLAAAGPGLAASPSAPAYHNEMPISGADGRWDLASFDPGHGRLVIARGDAVTIVDVATNTMRNVGAVVRGHAALAIPGTKLIAVTSGQDDSLRLLDADDGHETARISVGKNPDAALYDPRSGRIYVMNAKGGTVSVVDPVVARVVSDITVKPGLELATMVGPGWLAINDEEANEVEVVDLAQGAAIHPIALPGCEGPTGLAYDGRTMLLLSACANGKAALVDMRARRLVQLLTIGEGPDTVMFDQHRRRFLVPCGKSGTLAIFAIGRRGTVTRMADFPTEVGARTGAIDQASGRIYLPTARFQPAEPGKRPQPVPGSFHVLVLGPTD